VAQKRRRVFVVGYLGDWRPAAAVLFEYESLQGNFKSSRKKKQETPNNAEGGIGKSSKLNQRIFQPFRKAKKAKSKFDYETWEKGDKANTLNCFDQGDIKSTNVVAQPIITLDKITIRRLTPKECERLQGFPDDWTKISYRNKPADQCPDGPRYKACGNSMAVPVMQWIGKRINYINKMLLE
jgi:DNA (cytosine-5)-methyltransferase 1